MTGIYGPPLAGRVGQVRARAYVRAPTLLLVLAPMLVGTFTTGWANTKPVPFPRPRPTQLSPTRPEPASVAFRAAPLSAGPASAPIASDVGVVRQALELIRRGKADAATALEGSVHDPVAKK